jgi:hypothetical protein
MEGPAPLFVLTDDPADVLLAPGVADLAEQLSAGLPGIEGP